MMNLFSSFNPITSQNSSLNWMVMAIPIIIPTMSSWTLKGKTHLMLEMFMINMSNQFKLSLTKINYSNLLLTMTIMTIIMTINLTSLLPNTFSATSHIAVNMAMSLILWWALMKKKLFHVKKFLSILTPSNTPYLLIPFMVMIELVSLIIQPITLSVRLTANITAGHIMMTLISQTYNMSTILALCMNLTMMILELGVSMIQAYVFSLLIIMYSK